MINLVVGRGNLESLNTYLENKLNGLSKESDVSKKLNILIKRILKNEKCLLDTENTTHEYLRFLDSYFKIRKLSVAVGEEEKVTNALRSALRFARRHFTQQTVKNGDQKQYTEPLLTINKLKELDEEFYYQTLSRWIDKQKVPIEKLELSSKEMKSLAPHLTYLKISSTSSMFKDFDDRYVGKLLGRTRCLRYVTIKDSSITGAAFSKLQHTDRLERFVMRRCLHLDQPLPEALDALKELKVVHCPKWGKTHRLNFVASIYLEDRDRALRFAADLQLSHLSILHYLSHGPDPVDDVQSLVNRISDPRKRDLLWSILSVGGLKALLTYPPRLVAALLNSMPGRNLIEQNLVSFLYDPGLLQFVLTTYPPDRPENLSLYPIEVNHDSKSTVLHLTMISTMPRDYPDRVCDILLNTNCKKIVIKYYSSAEKGAGAPEQFFEDLMQGLIHSSQFYQFDKSDDGTYIPSFEEQHSDSLGKLLGMALHSGYAIGDVFSMKYLHCLRTFAVKATGWPLNPIEFLCTKNYFDLIDWMRKSVTKTAEFALVERVLMASFLPAEEETRAAIEELNSIWQDEELQDYMDEGDLHEIKHRVRLIWLFGYQDYFASVCLTARKMINHMPFVITRMDQAYKVKVKAHQLICQATPEEFAMQLQGRRAMLKRFVITPSYRIFVQDEILNFLRDLEVQQLLLATYPPGKPENSPFYPVAADLRDDILYLTMIPTMPREYPDTVLGVLTTYKAKKISIGHYGGNVVDRGGPKNEFFSDLMQGLIHSSTAIKFEKTDSGKLIPRFNAHAAVNYILGQFLGLALRFGCPIGDVFCKEFIHCLRLFPRADTIALREWSAGSYQNADLVAYMRDSTPPSPIMPLIERVLLSENEEIVRAAAMELNNQWCDEELDEAIKKIGGGLTQIKDIVRNNWLSNYNTYFSVAKNVACGMGSTLPFHVIVNDIERREIRNWDDLAFVATEELALQLQGKLTVKWIKDNLEFKPKLRLEAQQVKQWVEKWLDDHEGEDEHLANVIQTLTGARAVTTKITFKLSHAVNGFYAHTCFQEVDVPMDIDEEGVRQVLDAYGRGEHLQFNRS